jgi:hypothetical protein
LRLKITVEFPSVMGEERKTLGDRSLYQVEVAVCSLIWMLASSDVERDVGERMLREEFCGGGSCGSG